MNVKKIIVNILIFFKAYGQIKILFRRIKYLFNYRLVWRNFKFRRRRTPDGFPVPNSKLVYLVTDQYDIEAFYRIGEVGAGCIEEILKKNNIGINKFETILDFGCGCGRVIRHWAKLPECSIYGTDYNRELISWCRSSLSFAHFDQNQIEGPLKYEDDKFDFIYAISVFTHLSEELQKYWIEELFRIVKPGGVLYMTTHGKDKIGVLPEAEQEHFNSGNVVVVSEQQSGTNTCAAYHPEAYVRGTLAVNFEVVDFVSCGAKDANQDVFLLKKPEVNLIGEKSPLRMG